jgi:hypothetical protein
MKILSLVCLFFQGTSHGKRNGVSSETPQRGVFKALSSYRSSRNAEENNEAATGVFRVLSEDGPSGNERDLTATKVYVRSSEAAARIGSAVTNQSECKSLKTSSHVVQKTEVPESEASKTNPVTVKTSGKQRPVYEDKCSERSTRNDTTNVDSSEAKRGESEPGGDIRQHKFHPPGSVSEAVVGNRSRYSKLESSSSFIGLEEHKGMQLAARDTGQQHNFGLSVVSQLSRAGTISSSGSSYNFSSTTEATGDSRGLRETPMGSTTGLLPENSCSCSQSKFKVGTVLSNVTKYLDCDSSWLRIGCIWCLKISVM